MSEVSAATPAEVKASRRKRNLIIFSAAVPIAAFFVLLGWAVAQTGGNPGGFGINSKFGEVQVEQHGAPPFVVEALDGTQVSLPKLRGKVVMLDFWSSWCPPCRREAPALSQVYREYQGENVEFVGVAIWDDHGDVARFVQEFRIPYPNVLDGRGRIAINYGVTGIPEKFFIDTRGNLVRRFVGPIEPEALRAVLDELVGP